MCLPNSRKGGTTISCFDERLNKFGPCGQIDQLRPCTWYTISERAGMKVRLDLDVPFVFSLSQCLLVRSMCLEVELLSYLAIQSPPNYHLAKKCDLQVRALFLPRTPLAKAFGLIVLDLLSKSKKRGTLVKKLSITTT